MSTTHNGGMGPWFCSLYFSLADSPKKQTDLRVHTYPRLLERLMNGPKASAFGTGGWVLVMMVGYFEQWTDALAFYTLWAKQTRGKTRRMQRGLDLFARYRDEYKLKLWLQPQDRAHIRETYQESYATSSSPSSTLGDNLQLSLVCGTEQELALTSVYQLQQKRGKRKRV